MKIANTPMISLGRTFEVVSKKRSEGELFKHLKVGDRIKITLELIKPGRTCTGLSKAPMVEVKDINRDIILKRTLVQVINMMSRFEWKEITE